MGKKPAEREKKAGRVRPVLLNLTEDEYQALRNYCFPRELKFAPFIRKVLAERLEKEARKS